MYFCSVKTSIFCPFLFVQQRNVFRLDGEHLGTLMFKSYHNYIYVWTLSGPFSFIVLMEQKPPPQSQVFRCFYQIFFQDFPVISLIYLSINFVQLQSVSFYYRALSIYRTTKIEWSNKLNEAEENKAYRYLMVMLVLRVCLSLLKDPTALRCH